MTEQTILLEKLNKIRDLHMDIKLKQKVGSIIFDENYNNIETRIKTDVSAINKFRVREYNYAWELRDLIGIMIVTNTEEEVYKIAKKIILKNNDCKIKDYIKNPKNGYKSIHINYSFNTKELSDIPVEIQIKTEGMKKAQDLVHDTIYKNENIPPKFKGIISKMMFKYIESKQKIDNTLQIKSSSIYKLNEYLK